MSGLDGRLPDEVLEALNQGWTIEAIKRLRSATGLGLKEAKDLIEAYQKGLPISVPTHSAADGPVQTWNGATLPPSVVEALLRGERIEGIKRFRALTGLGLKEAVDAIDAWPGFATEKRNALGPGEVPRSRWGVLWFGLMIILAGAAWVYFKTPS